MLNSLATKVVSTREKRYQYKIKEIGTNSEIGIGNMSKNSSAILS